MEKRNGKTAFACIVEFSAFEPNEFLELYTPLRRRTLEGTGLARAKLQSAAAELAYLAAARAALEGGLFGTDEAGEYAGASADELKKRFEYSYGENGKPVLSGAFMSLSHTDGAALAVIAPFPVGADAERERRVSARIAKRMMNAGEFEAFSLLSSDGKNERILECWTAKESFLKLTGEGILAGLDKLNYDRENKAVRRETTGEIAHAVRLDTDLSADIKGAACEAERGRLFACVCCRERAWIELLRFHRVEDAARFIRSGKLPQRDE